MDLKLHVMVIYLSIFSAQQAAASVDEPASSLPESYKGKYGDGTVEGPYFEGPVTNSEKQAAPPPEAAKPEPETTSSSTEESVSADTVTIPKSVFERSSTSVADGSRQIGISANLSEGVGMQLSYLNRYNNWIGIRSYLGGRRSIESSDDENQFRQASLNQTAVHIGSDIMLFLKNPTNLTPMVGMGPSWEFVEQRRGEQQSIRDNSPVISYIYGCVIRLGKFFEIAAHVRQLTYFGTPPRDYDTGLPTEREHQRLGLSFTANYRL